MFYEHDITVTANTLATAKVHEFVKLTQGVIHQVSVSFQAGCHNMVFVTINRSIHQIFPTNPDGYIKGNNIEIKGTVFHPLFAEPYGVDIYLWSPDTAHSHTVTFRFWILRLWQLLPYSDEMYNLMVREGEL